MYKLLSTNLDEGDHISLSLAERDRHTFNKVANKKEFPDEIDEAIKNLDKKKGHSYVLLTAMGDGDTWGANNNADHFPRNALLGIQNTPTKWGSVSYEPGRDERSDVSRKPRQRFKTFEDAHFFHHHRNKIDRCPSFGRVLRSVWFPKMGTILLLIEIDDKKDPESAEAAGRGEPLFFSMGCTVPYDVCSICGNRAATLFQYCDHLRDQKNRILPDGRRVFALNLHPRFFDISKVTRPAFVAGAMLQKVASSQIVETMGSVELADLYDLASFDKCACGAPPNTDDVPPHLTEAADLVSNLESAVPFDNIKSVVAQSGGDVCNALGAFAYRGIVLKPNEFAATLLLSAGKDDLAKRVHASRVVLDENPKPPENPETAELSTPSAGHAAKALGAAIPDSVANERSVLSVEDRFYEIGKNKLIKTSSDIVSGPALGVGAVMTGLYMLYRDKIKKHPILSAVIGASLGRTLLRTSGNQSLFMVGNPQAEEERNKQSSLQQAYLLKSYV